MTCYSIGLFISGYIGFGFYFLTYPPCALFCFFCMFFFWKILPFTVYYLRVVAFIAWILKSNMQKRHMGLSMIQTSMVNPFEGEKYSQRIVLSVGTFLNATTLFIFGCILPWMKCTSFYPWVLLWVWVIKKTKSETDWFCFAFRNLEPFCFIFAKQNF